MKDKFSSMKLPYSINILGITFYFAILAGVYYLFAGRNSESTQINFFLEWDAGFYSHMTNFVLSFVIVFATGFMEILRYRRLKSTLIIAIILIAINFIYEWYIPILNTLDKVDAYYGFIGSILPLPFLYLIKKWGVKINPDFKE